MDFPRSPGSSPGTDDPPRFAIRADLSTGWIYIAGWLDHPTSHLLHDTFSALLQAQHTCWNLDVTELTGVDDAGLRALGAANRRATRHGRQLILHGATPALQQDLTRLRLNHHLSCRWADGRHDQICGTLAPLAEAGSAPPPDSLEE